jgi:predicted enzyme related to lactoylglutathione lyase
MPTIVALMIHVPSPSDALAWYRRAFPGAEQVNLIGGLHALRIGEVQLEFVPADDKVTSGAAGTVAYWHVPEFNAALSALLSVGASLYRGPLDIQDGLAMCQVRDPWGNCIGIRGKRA